MIIDAHGHVSAPAELYSYKSALLALNGSHGRMRVNISDDDLRKSVAGVDFWEDSHLNYIDKLGINIQAISPRPVQMMHSTKPFKIVRWFCEETNDVIYRTTKLWPGRFFGVAGLPQGGGEPVDAAVEELERCVKELDFKGCLLNPDPYENDGNKSPPMGDRYWYPLYEKLCELDVPAHIHGTGSRCEREPYTVRFINEETTCVYGLVTSQVLDDFPSLKVIISHGGGAIPYQLGRFEAPSIREGGAKDPSRLFSSRMKKLYYDTVLYTPDALRLLVKTVGADRCLFGTECPGVGSRINPETGLAMDDIAPVVAGIDWLTEDEKEDILWRNSARVFNLDVAAMTAAATPEGVA